jgi:hypothetical protein
MQDLIIKNIPTQQIADRLMDVAKRLTDDCIEQARKLTEEQETEIRTEKEAFRIANSLSVDDLPRVASDEPEEPKEVEDADTGDLI